MAKTPKPPPPIQPWDPKPTQPEGDPTSDPLFGAVGVALTAWERLNDAQGMLFGALVNSRRGAAAAAFGYEQSSAVRALMVMEAAKSVYPIAEPLLVEIIDLIGKMANLSGCRNDIAHGLVSGFYSQKAPEPEKFWGHFLIPAHSNTRKRLSREDSLKVLVEHGIDGPPQYGYRYAYTSVQVYEFGEAFDEHRKKVVDLTLRVQKDLRERDPPQALRELEYERRLHSLQTRVSELEAQLQQRSSPETEANAEGEQAPPSGKTD